MRTLQEKSHATFRLCDVSGHKTDVLEIHTPNPEFHVVFVPGNPGVITFYTNFLESLFMLLEGKASVTAIGHVGHTKKTWEHGRLFSLQEQIHLKISFIEQQLGEVEVPLVLVGHSIGAYMSMEIFKQLQQKVFQFVCYSQFHCGIIGNASSLGQ